jgi:hypothetical protein
MLTLADRLFALPDFARVNDPGLHIAIGERAVASGDADEAAEWAVAAFDLDASDLDFLAAIAADAIRWS